MESNGVLAKTQMAKDAILQCDFDLSAEMRRVLIVIDGERTVGQVVDMLPNLANVDLLLEDLEALGFVEFVRFAQGVKSKQYVESGNTVRVSADSGSHVYAFPKQRSSTAILSQVKSNPVSQAGSNGLPEIVRSLKRYMQQTMGNDYYLVETKIDNCDSFSRLATVLQGCEKVLNAYHGTVEMNAFKKCFNAYF